MKKLQTQIFYLVDSKHMSPPSHDSNRVKQVLTFLYPVHLHVIPFNSSEDKELIIKFVKNTIRIYMDPLYPVCFAGFGLGGTLASILAEHYSTTSILVEPELVGPDGAPIITDHGVYSTLPIVIDLLGPKSPRYTHLGFEIIGLDDKDKMKEYISNSDYID